MNTFLLITLSWLSLASKAVAYGNKQHLKVAPAQAGHDSIASDAGTRKLLEDAELTNTDFKMDRPIYPFSVTLTNTPVELNPDQVEAVMTTIHDILMNKFPDYSNEMSTIYNITLKAPSVNFEGSRRMVRNGRYLADGASTEAKSIFNIPGGEATVKNHVEYDNPSRTELNDAIVSILEDNLLNEMSKQEAFKELSGIEIFMPEVDPYTYERADKITETEITIAVNDRQPISVGAIVGVVAAVCVALVALYTAHRKGSLQRMGEKYKSARSTLRTRSLRRGLEDEEYLVEVCTEDEPPKRSPLRKKTSVRPSDFVIEVGTD